MDVFEQMWKELVERIQLANQFSVNKSLTYQDILSLLVSYEQHFTEEIQAKQEEQAQEAIQKGKEQKDKK
jgi:hypothetical protein